MVSAEPHIYITMPSARLWIKNHRGTAVASAIAAVLVLVAAIVLIVFLAT